MVKNTTASDGLGVAFPIPFYLEQLREDILILFFQQIRTIAWMTDAKTAWNILGFVSDYENELYDPDTTPSTAGLSYSHIENTAFAKAIEDMYLYAYLGIEDKEYMGDESIYTWITTILDDMRNSVQFDYWDAYAAQCDLTAIQRCYQIAELANARRVLEGNENFIHYTNQSHSKDSFGFENLTIRQMALLSGMEEMSIRAAANPKRANPLPTFSDEGSTRIKLDDAKEWLKSKNRYVQITKKNIGSQLDLTKRRFSSIEDLIIALEARFKMLALDDANDDITEQLTKNEIVVSAGTSEIVGKYIEIDPNIFKDTTKVTDLASALNLNKTLLSIRVRETLAIEEIAKIEREIKEFIE